VRTGPPTVMFARTVKRFVLWCPKPKGRFDTGRRTVVEYDATYVCGIATVYIAVEQKFNTNV